MPSMQSVGGVVGVSSGIEPCKPTSNVSYALNLTTVLPKDVALVAAKQGENASTVCAYVEELRNMIYERGEFEPDRTDDEFLLKFLRSRFFKLDKSYTLLRNYYKFRNTYPELHRNLNPLRLVRLGADDVVNVSPWKDHKHRRIMFFKIGKWRPSRISVTEIVATTLLLLELGALEPVSQVMGGIGLFDFTGYSLNHMWYCSPTIVQQVIALIVTSVPQRTCEIHIVHNGWVFDLMFRMFKPFLDERMLRKIHFHGDDMQSLHRHIAPAHLPAAYGGTMPDIDYREWMKSLSSDAQIMGQLEQQGYVFEDLADMQF